MLLTRTSVAVSIGLCLASFALRISLSNAQTAIAKSRANPPLEGRRIFNSSCAGCHGLDGKGSDKASNIAKNPAIQQLSDAELFEIISSGVPETGMPAFHSLGEKRIRSIIEHVRMLQGRTGGVGLAGNPEQGRKIFFGKGECANCHALAGEGRYIGPDLTGYGATTSPTEIRDAIISTSRAPVRGYRSAVAVKTNGDRIEGVLRNEDNFSVQLQTADGGFHLLNRADLLHLDVSNRSVMPTNYNQRLDMSELNDLVSYLMTAARPGKMSALSKKTGTE